ncbi:MAG: FKBP-type peptidyl-prolyl cis-trans isomerase, partial [Gloeobacteraceae cyanobacterium ES-bin-316]|nr:FKBP-type peptidyl-prolyl cis-trans isomerase [Ferruginibacter sp.]
MMKKTALCLMAVVSITIGANAQTKKPVAKPAAKPVAKTATNPAAKAALAPSLMKTGIDSFSYAVGLNIASSMQQQGVTKINGSLMQKAIDDVLNNRKKSMTDEQANMCLQQKIQEFSQQKSSVEKSKGDLFLAANKKRAGVISLPNGLQYEIITAGEAGGMKPTAMDTVVVHYIGTLTD